jgi:hypothetical protein
MPDQDKKSDLENAVEDLGKVATGVFGRMFGPKAVGKERLDADSPTLSPEADKALAEVSEGFGKLLHAVGEGLKQHPTDPIAAVNTFAEKTESGEAPPPLEGWSGLSSGAKSLGEGIGTVAERVLDAVAPRKPRGTTADAGADDAGDVAENDAGDEAAAAPTGTERTDETG